MSENIILCKEIKSKPKKYCIFEDCKTLSNYNMEGETTGLYCSSHKKENMVNVKHKTCIFENCKTISNYNFEGETKPLYCSYHK